MTSKTQNGPGGACEMQWCEKEKQSQALPMKGCLQPSDKNVKKRAPLPPGSNILIPGLLAQTYNMKNVKHQATIP